MKKIKICDLPEAKSYDFSKKIALHVFEKTESKVLLKLEELGWMWRSRGKLTTHNPRDNGFSFPSGLKLWLWNDGCICHSDRNYIDNEWEEFEALDNEPELLTSLKTANTSSSATHCASCGSQLKDPGMGPVYKHCPKCEP